MMGEDGENTIQYKHEYYYSGIKPVEFREKESDDGKTVKKRK